LMYVITPFRFKDVLKLCVLFSCPPQNDVLAVLKPAADERRRYVVPECMEGTRRALFEEIGSWVNDFDAPNVLWISGRPGSGKSAIASSLVSELTKLRRLASHFFCKRDYLRLGDPAVLWRTVASDLAGFNPAVKASLLELLKKADFKDTDILLHFHCFIAAPLTKNSNHSSAPPPVVVLDGLDECGSDESQFAQRSTSVMQAHCHQPGWVCADIPPEPPTLPSRCTRNRESHQPYHSR